MAGDAGPVADDGTDPGNPVSPFGEADATSKQASETQAAFDTLRHERAYVAAIRKGAEREAQAYQTTGR